MSIEILNAETVFNKKGKPPIVFIESGRNARINFSVEAVKLLDLKEGMRISFILLNKDKEIIYFYEDEKTGIPLKLQMDAKSGKRLAISCRPLARKLNEHFGYGDAQKTFLLTKDKSEVEGKKMWFILKSKQHKPIQWRKKEAVV